MQKCRVQNDPLTYTHCIETDLASPHEVPGITLTIVEANMSKSFPCLKFSQFMACVYALVLCRGWIVAKGENQSSLCLTFYRDMVPSLSWGGEPRREWALHCGLQPRLQNQSGSWVFKSPASSIHPRVTELEFLELGPKAAFLKCFLHCSAKFSNDRPILSRGEGIGQGYVQEQCLLR